MKRLCCILLFLFCFGFAHGQSIVYSLSPCKERILYREIRRSERQLSKRFPDQVLLGFSIRKDEDNHILLYLTYGNTADINPYYSLSDRFLLVRGKYYPLYFDYDSIFGTISKLEDISGTVGNRDGYTKTFFIDDSPSVMELFRGDVHMDYDYINTNSINSMPLIYILPGNVELALYNRCQQLEEDVLIPRSMYLSHSYNGDTVIVPLTFDVSVLLSRGCRRCVLIGDMLYPLLFDYDMVFSNGINLDGQYYWSRALYFGRNSPPYWDSVHLSDVQ